MEDVRAEAAVAVASARETRETREVSSQRVRLRLDSG